MKNITPFIEGIEVWELDQFKENDDNYKRVRCQQFDFKKIPASSGIYGIHPYPAMFHFMLVRDLLENYSVTGDLILDPFMGSGVTAGECLISGRSFIGYDINPLAVLIAKVRTTPINYKDLMDSLTEIVKSYPNVKGEKTQFKNINYWFNSEAINVLSKIKQVILRIEQNDIKDFFLVAFAETVRMVSNAKYNEFKLLRKKEVNPLNTAQVFSKISLKNMELLCNFYQKNLPQKVLIKLEMLDITDGIPIGDETIDLVITSPPYGDSRTTVAYGQFSRLPLQWLGWDCNIDNLSLGAKPAMVRAGLPSKILYEVVKTISTKSEKRAKDVFGFYTDLFKAIRIISRKVKLGGYVCFVVGNRRVKSIQLPTDVISADFFAALGFEHEKTIVRAISNKRMPIENSPTNMKGERETTMKYEYIVILRKVNSSP